MLFGESGSGNVAPVTSYVRYAVRNMNATNKPALVSMLNSLHINNDKGSNAPYGYGMFEAYKYFGGGGTLINPQNSNHYGLAAFGGAGQLKRDYSATLSPTRRAASRAMPSFPRQARTT